MSQQAISLKRLFPDAQFVNCDDIKVTRAVTDSRRVSTGDTFVAVPGTQVDGHRFIDASVAAGAAGVLAEHQTDHHAAQCIVSSARAAFAKLSMLLHCGTIGGITTAGITGTNGKTTTSYLLRSILKHAGLQTGLLGTIETCDGKTTQPATMTTPCAEQIAKHYHEMQSIGTSHSIAEISSHAIDQHRCTAVPLSVAAITNITQDHFDYHGSLERYREAKCRIADLLHLDAPILLNAEDNECRQLFSKLQSHPVITFGSELSDAELQSEVLSTTHRSQRVSLQLAQGTAEVRLRLIGRHNVSNSLCAAGMAEQLGIRIEDIVGGLEAVHAVPGRLERVDEGQTFQLLIDYAHTPDALSRCLRTIRPFAPGRVICVFGAGGDRDKSKRPLMGQAASLADFSIVTSDNPRSECPDQIISQVVVGMRPAARWLSEPDRKRAIATAIAVAEPGDVIVIAGKGHETYQEIHGTRHPFDDRAVSRQLLQELIDGHSETPQTPVFSLSKSA